MNIIPFEDPRTIVVLGTWIGISLLGMILMVVFRKPRKENAETPTKESGEKQPASKGGFWQKLGSYLLINLLFFILAWSSYNLYAASVVALGFCCMYEVAGASRWCKDGKGFFATPLWYASTCAVVISAFAVNIPEMTFKIIVTIGIVHTIIASFFGDLRLLLNRAALAGISTLYFPLCLGCHLYLKYVDPTGFLVIFYYVVVCATDSFGQITGTIFKGPKLAPLISPGKTVSGAIGGTVAAVVVALIIRKCLPGTPVHWVALAGLVISLAAQIGDLVISTWKRFMGIKDFSENLGAHGGVIDRFDSMLLAASVFFIFTSVMPH